MTAVTATLYYPVISLRVVQAIPDVELERRRKQIRNLMSTRDIDLLIFHSMGEYLRYVSNYLGVTRPEYIILPAEGEMIFIGRNEDSVAEARTHFGLAEAQALPSDALNSTTVEAENVAGLVNKFTPKCVGLVGVSNLPAAFYERLKELLGAVKVVDATPLIDEVRKVKSRAEIVAIERSAIICDRMIQACLQSAQPGKREYEVIADIDREARKSGSESQQYVTGCGPGSKEVLNLSMNLKNRILSKGDLFRFHTYISGPGGYWTEISRTMSIGSMTPDAERAFHQALEVRNAAVEKMNPGVNVSSIYKAALEKAKEIGCSMVTSIIGYSQGLGIYERPVIYTGEDEEVKVGMHFSLKCVARVGKAYGQVCDNYLVTEDGLRRLQKTAEEPLITEV